jgi:hypothetical protein
MFALALAFAIGAFVVRDGLPALGHTTWARAVCCVFLMVVASFAGASFGLALLVGASFFPGISWAPFHTEGVTMGRDKSPQGKTWVESVSYLTLNGVLTVFIPAIVVGFAGTAWAFLPLLVAGALHPLGYELGWQLRERFGWFQVPNFPETRFGAAFFGFMFGVALLLSL